MYSSRRGSASSTVYARTGGERCSGLVGTAGDCTLEDGSERRSSSLSVTRGGVGVFGRFARRPGLRPLAPAVTGSEGECATRFWRGAVIN